MRRHSRLNGWDRPPYKAEAETDVREPVPYDLDVRKPRDLSDIVRDPVFLKSLQDARTAHVHVYSDDNQNPEIPAEHVEAIQDHVRSFIGNASRAELARVGIDIDDVHESKRDGTFKETLEEFVEDLGQVLQDAVASGTYSALSDFPYETRAFRGGPHGRSGFFEREHNMPESLVVPAEDIDPEEVRDMFLDRDHEQLAGPPAGTSQEWAALITWHELEHTADDRQHALQSYYSRVKDEYGLTDTDSVLMKEVEADCGAFHGLEGHLSPEMQDYFIALRIASTFEDDLKHYGRDEEGAATTHSTGFHLAEFHHTGHMPDYYDMQDQVRGFYQAVYQRTAEITDELKADSERFRMSDITSNPDVMVAMVEYMRDEGEFSPAQEQLAEQFLKSYQALGITAAENPVMKVIETYQDRIEWYDAAIKRIEERKAEAERTKEAAEQAQGQSPEESQPEAQENPENTAAQSPAPAAFMP